MFDPLDPENRLALFNVRDDRHIHSHTHTFSFNDLHDAIEWMKEKKGEVLARLLLLLFLLLYYYILYTFYVKCSSESGQLGRSVCVCVCLGEGKHQDRLRRRRSRKAPLEPNKIQKRRRVKERYWYTNNIPYCIRSIDGSHRLFLFLGYIIRVDSLMLFSFIHSCYCWLHSCCLFDSKVERSFPK